MTNIVLLSVQLVTNSLPHGTVVDITPDGRAFVNPTNAIFIFVKDLNLNLLPERQRPREILQRFSIGFHDGTNQTELTSFTKPFAYEVPTIHPAPAPTWKFHRAVN